MAETIPTCDPLVFSPTADCASTGDAGSEFYRPPSDAGPDRARYRLHQKRKESSGDGEKADILAKESEEARKRLHQARLERLQRMRREQQESKLQRKLVDEQRMQELETQQRQKKEESLQRARKLGMLTAKRLKDDKEMRDKELETRLREEAEKEESKRIQNEMIAAEELRRCRDRLKKRRPTSVPPISQEDSSLNRRRSNTFTSSSSAIAAAKERVHYYRKARALEVSPRDQSKTPSTATTTPTPVDNRLLSEEAIEESRRKSAIRSSELRRRTLKLQQEQEAQLALEEKKRADTLKRYKDPHVIAKVLNEPAAIESKLRVELCKAESQRLRDEQVRRIEQKLERSTLERARRLTEKEERLGLSEMQDDDKSTFSSVDEATEVEIPRKPSTAPVIPTSGLEPEVSRRESRIRQPSWPRLHESTIDPECRNLAKVESSTKLRRPRRWTQIEAVKREDLKYNDPICCERTDVESSLALDTSQVDRNGVLVNGTVTTHPTQKQLNVEDDGRGISAMLSEQIVKPSSPNGRLSNQPLSFEPLPGIDSPRDVTAPECTSQPDVSSSFEASPRPLARKGPLKQMAFSVLDPPSALRIDIPDSGIPDDFDSAGDSDSPIWNMLKNPASNPETKFIPPEDQSTRPASPTGAAGPQERLSPGSGGNCHDGIESSSAKSSSACTALSNARSGASSPIWHFIGRTPASLSGNYVAANDQESSADASPTGSHSTPLNPCVELMPAGTPVRTSPHQMSIEKSSDFGSELILESVELPNDSSFLPIDADIDCHAAFPLN